MLSLRMKQYQHWRRIPSDQESNTYWFDGHFIVSDKVAYELSQEEIQGIYIDIKTLVLLRGAQYHTQVYVHPFKQDKLYLVDYTMQEEQNDRNDREMAFYCKLMFQHELSQRVMC